MNSTFVSILQQLISEQGKEALLNPAKCKAFLADYTRGEYKKESRLLLQALEAGVAKAIDDTKELEICKQQQARVLQEEHFLAAEAAADVVDTLALVLSGDASKTQTKQPETKTQQAPMPSPAPVVQTPSPAQTGPLPSSAPGMQAASSSLATPPKKKRHTALYRAAVVIAVLGLLRFLIVFSSNPEDIPFAEPFRWKGSRYLDDYNFDKARAIIHLDKAITQFTIAIWLSPNYTWAYTDRGYAYLWKGQYNKAIRDFNKLIRLNQNNADAYIARARVYMSNGQYELAIRDLDEAVRLEPNDKNYHAYYIIRGFIYSMKGQYDMAINDFDNAIRLEPDNFFDYLYRGQAYRQIGQRDHAIRDFEIVLSLNPNNEEAKKELQELRGY